MYDFSPIVGRVQPAITSFPNALLQSHLLAREVALNQTQLRLLQGTRLSVVPLVFVLLASGSATAQQGLGFDFSFGHQWVGGDYGDVLKGGVDAEFAVLYTHRRLRYGFGSNWASYGVAVEGFQKESWSNITSHLGLAYFPLADEKRLRPFIEVRLEGRRLRPEGDHLPPEVPPEDPEDGENTSEIRVFGVGGATLVGVEIGMWRGAWAKVAGYWGVINTEDAELGDINLGTVDSGSVAGFRVGIVWTP